MSGPNFGLTGLSYIDQEVSPNSSVLDQRQRATVTMLWDVAAIGSGNFHFVRDILANVTLGGAWIYQTPSSASIQSGVSTDLSGFGLGGVMLNPSGVAGTGSGVSPLYNSSGQNVAYQANNPNAQYIAGAAGTYNAARYTIPLQPSTTSMPPSINASRFETNSASRFTAMPITS